MSTINYNNDNTEEVMKDLSETTNSDYPTYPMYCPLCNYSMPMRNDYNDLDEYDDDLDEYDDDDPGYRQRHRRRRRRRRRRMHPFFFPRPFFFPFFFPYDDDWD